MQKQIKNNINYTGNDIIKENNIKMEYNNDYKEQLNLEKFKNLINHEKDPDLKDFYWRDKPCSPSKKSSGSHRPPCTAKNCST